MGVCYTSRVFEVSREVKNRVNCKEHYYIDMEQGNIIFDEDIEDFIQGIREAYGDYYDDLDDDQLLRDCEVIDVDYRGDYCYGINEINFFETSSGDIVCIINYAW